MEGGCSKLLNAETVQADYSPQQLPMDSPEWAGNLGKADPVCEYTLSFVHKTIALFMKQNDKEDLPRISRRYWQDSRGNQPKGVIHRLWSQPFFSKFSFLAPF